MNTVVQPNLASRFQTRPLYLQVRDLLVQRIVTGEWTPRSALPNENQLAQELCVSLGTIRKALDEMAAERIIVRKQGRGTFVSDHSSEEMAIRFSNICNKDDVRLEGTIVPVKTSRGSASEQEARALSLGRNSEVWRIVRHHLVNESLFMIENAVLPVARFKYFDAKQSDYRICILAQKNHVLLRGAIERLTIARADESAKHFKCAIDQPLLVMDRIIYAIDGRPVEWRVARCHLNDMHYVSRIS